MCVVVISKEDWLDLRHISQYIALISIATIAWFRIDLVEVLAIIVPTHKELRVVIVG